MATKAYEERELELQDDTPVDLRPLNIARLRRFMKEWKKFGDLPEDADESAGYDIFVNCSGVALEANFKDQTGDGKQFPNGLAGNSKEPLSKEYRAYLEEVLDIDTIYVIFDVCAGMKLNDPNLMAALAKIQEDGTA